MRIVHVTTIDEGGAYKAVKRINECMIQMGFSSSILLRNKIDLNNEGNVFLNNIFKKLKSKLMNGINLLLKRGNISRDILGSDISNNELIKNADVIMIHWINSFLSVDSLEKLMKMGKKIIFYMHDTWLFTGGCHINLECNRFKLGCGCCPLLGNLQELDISYRNFNDKKIFMDKYDVEIIGPGTQIVLKASQSLITKNKTIYMIPNPINLGVFKEQNDNIQLKSKYGIPYEKKIILFGAAFNGIRNKAKGFIYLQNGLKYLDESYALVIFGNADKKDLINFKQKYYILGYISDEKEMAEIYSMADVYVTPSLQESFGYTILESLSCGTPVVAFDNGGSNDLILHKKNGYLAKYKNEIDLAEGIAYCCDKKNQFILSKSAVEQAQNYSYEKIGCMYKELLLNKI